MWLHKGAQGICGVSDVAVGRNKEHEHKHMHNVHEQLCGQCLNQDFSYQCHESVFQDPLLSCSSMEIFTINSYTTYWLK